MFGKLNQIVFTILKKQMIPHMNGLLVFIKMKKKMAYSKNLIFQLHKFSIFFHKNFMAWSLG
jgi:hypothetical protein